MSSGVEAFGPSPPPVVALAKIVLPMTNSRRATAVTLRMA